MPTNNFGAWWKYCGTFRFWARYSFPFYFADCIKLAGGYFIPTVYLVEDDKETCKALKWLLESVQITTRTFNSALEFLDFHHPELLGCIILDIRMPEMSGMELLSELRSRSNHLPVIVMTGYGDISIAVRAMKLGAYDFLTKPFHEQYFLELIQSVLVRSTQTSLDCSDQKAKACLENLSARERQILEMVANGKMNKEISRELGIAISTVELHRSRMMKKVKAKTFGELIKLYYTLS